MKNTRTTYQVLRGETEVQAYWDESGHQQVRSAGVFLTAEQHDRVVKQLNRLAGTVRPFVPASDTIASDEAVADGDHQRAFERYLATFQ